MLQFEQSGNRKQGPEESGLNLSLIRRWSRRNGVFEFHLRGGRGGDLVVICEAWDSLLLGKPGLGKTRLNSRTSKPKLLGCTWEAKFKTIHSLVIYWCKICNKCKTGISTFIMGVFFNWCPPKNHKFFSVSKFWHLELFWWNLLHM